MPYRLCLVISVFLLGCTAMFPAFAVNSVSVQGLFKNKAVLLVDGKRHVLEIGETSKEGVHLVSINGDEVVLEFDGSRRRHKLGENIAFTTHYPEPKFNEVVISQDLQGMFTTVGSINGSVVTLLVDTGADIVAMNSQHAKRLGIDYKSSSQLAMIATASGMTKGYQVKLKTVSVGEIMLRDVDAVVLEGGHPMQILLGMSFLGNLEIQRVGNVMKIKKTW